MRYGVSFCELDLLERGVSRILDGMGGAPEAATIEEMDDAVATVLRPLKVDVPPPNMDVPPFWKTSVCSGAETVASTTDVGAPLLTDPSDTLGADEGKDEGEDDGGGEGVGDCVAAGVSEASDDDTVGIGSFVEGAVVATRVTADGVAL